MGNAVLPEVPPNSNEISNDENALRLLTQSSSCSTGTSFTFCTSSSRELLILKQSDFNDLFKIYES